MTFDLLLSLFLVTALVVVWLVTYPSDGFICVEQTPTFAHWSYHLNKNAFPSVS